MSAAVAVAAPPLRETPLRRAWTRLKRRKGAMAALAVLTVIALLAIFAPLIAPHDPIKQGWASVRKAPPRSTGSALTRWGATSSPASSTARAPRSRPASSR